MRAELTIMVRVQELDYTGVPVRELAHEEASFEGELYHLTLADFGPVAKRFVDDAFEAAWETEQ